YLNAASPFDPSARNEIDRARLLQPGRQAGRQATNFFEFKKRRVIVLEERYNKSSRVMFLAVLYIKHTAAAQEAEEGALKDWRWRAPTGGRGTASINWRVNLSKKKKKSRRGKTISKKPTVTKKPAKKAVNSKKKKKKKKPSRIFRGIFLVATKNKPVASRRALEPVVDVHHSKQRQP
ncbi:hypothetical protein CTAYLR_005762, partial [Chrysophaeum taylorii]